MVVRHGEVESDAIEVLLGLCAADGLVLRQEAVASLCYLIMATTRSAPLPVA
jgi:hypothetical protein